MADAKINTETDWTGKSPLVNFSDQEISTDELKVLEKGSTFVHIERWIQPFLKLNYTDWKENVSWIIS